MGSHDGVGNVWRIVPTRNKLFSPYGSVRCRSVTAGNSAGVTLLLSLFSPTTGAVVYCCFLPRRSTRSRERGELPFQVQVFGQDILDCGRTFGETQGSALIDADSPDAKNYSSPV